MKFHKPTVVKPCTELRPFLLSSSRCSRFETTEGVALQAAAHPRISLLCSQRISVSKSVDIGSLRTQRASFPNPSPPQSPSVKSQSRHPSTIPASLSLLLPIVVKNGIRDSFKKPAPIGVIPKSPSGIILKSATDAPLFCTLKTQPSVHVDCEGDDEMVTIVPLLKSPQQQELVNQQLMNQQLQQQLLQLDLATQQLDQEQLEQQQLEQQLLQLQLQQVVSDQRCKDAPLDAHLSRHDVLPVQPESEEAWSVVLPPPFLSKNVVVTMLDQGWAKLKDAKKPIAILWADLITSARAVPTLVVSLLERDRLDIKKSATDFDKAKSISVLDTSPISPIFVPADAHVAEASLGRSITSGQVRLAEQGVDSGADVSIAMKPVGVSLEVSLRVTITVVESGPAYVLAIPGASSTVCAKCPQLETEARAVALDVTTAAAIHDSETSAVALMNPSWRSSHRENHPWGPNKTNFLLRCFS